MRPERLQDQPVAARRARQSTRPSVFRGPQLGLKEMESVKTCSRSHSGCGGPSSPDNFCRRRLGRTPDRVDRCSRPRLGAGPLRPLRQHPSHALRLGLGAQAPVHLFRPPPVLPGRPAPPEAQRRTGESLQCTGRGGTGAGAFGQVERLPVDLERHIGSVGGVLDVGHAEQGPGPLVGAVDAPRDLLRQGEVEQGLAAVPALGVSRSHADQRVRLTQAVPSGAVALQCPPETGQRPRGIAHRLVHRAQVGVQDGQLLPATVQLRQYS